MDDKKKVEKARARKHKISWTQFFYLLLLFAAVGISIWVIEYFR